MTRASYSATPLLRSLVHRPQGVILVEEVSRETSKHFHGLLNLVSTGGLLP